MNNMNTAWAGCSRVIIVCGHAVFTGGLNCPPEAAAHDSNWILQSFQAGEGPHYLRHIEHGVHLASHDPRALLLFSGGQTRIGAPLSEGLGYLHAAAAHSWWGLPQVAARTTTEEFARDSLENVLFGIARFYECVGSFPEHVTIISWTFKQGRFAKHVDALHWPHSKYSFAGISNPKAKSLTSALIAEEHTLQKFHRDPMGSAPGGELLAKRYMRNPAHRQNGYAISCPLLAPVLGWEGEVGIPLGMAPWEEKG